MNRLSNRRNLDLSRDDLSEHRVNITVLRALPVLYIHKTLTGDEVVSYAAVEQSSAIESMVISVW